MTMSSSERPIRRVLIADDSELMRSMLREQITYGGAFEVAGEASTGYQVIRLVHELDPDIITLDLAMPDFGGVEALDYVLSQAPRPVVIISAHDRDLVDPALNAMVSGAVEFVAKPADSSVEEALAFRNRLYQALRAASVAHLLNLPRRIQMSQERASRPHDSAPARCAVAIGASTGGPRALTEVVPRLAADMPAAVFIVQHMPLLFTAAFARRLDHMSALPVREAEEGEVVVEGVVYVARGGSHLDLQRDGNSVRIVLSDAPPVWNVRPAADVLFRAVARTFGPASVGVVLTGMGRDGAEGLRLIAEVGGSTLAQDEDSSVIASMPRAAAPHAQRIVPITELGGEIVRQAVLRSRART
ncbi:MAG: chemotaxis-specific protein-glutamate methyltransferase CheB [Gemmatimonadetes bacterium]|nr:chemotaxis-specific protein-glutamate methyltransferase CheB [Gemmatimonadota bacterium]